MTQWVALIPGRHEGSISWDQFKAVHARISANVAGQTAKSIAALANIKRLCDERLVGRYEIEVIDLLEHPQLAAGDQILAIPTLVRKLPEPVKKIIGDLSNEHRVLVGLDLRPRG